MDSLNILISKLTHILNYFIVIWFKSGDLIWLNTPNTPGHNTTRYDDFLIKIELKYYFEFIHISSYPFLCYRSRGIHNTLMRLYGKISCPLQSPNLAFIRMDQCSTPNLI